MERRKSELLHKGKSRPSLDNYRGIAIIAIYVRCLPRLLDLEYKQ